MIKVIEANESVEDTSQSTAIITSEVINAPVRMKPRATIEQATEVANLLVNIIEKQKLYSVIQGKKYVKVDAWVCLGGMMGVYPKERCVKRLDDGSYEAYVELIDRHSGNIVVGGASSLCGMDEKRWGGAENYARRSMAVTRATGKAFRLYYSWIMCMAGYESTPMEEMPAEEKTSDVYTGDQSQQEKIADFLRAKKIDEKFWPSIHDKMTGRKGKDLPKVIQEVMATPNAN